MKSAEDLDNLFGEYSGTAPIFRLFFFFSLPSSLLYLVSLRVDTPLLFTATETETLLGSASKQPAKQDFIDRVIITAGDWKQGSHLCHAFTCVCWFVLPAMLVAMLFGVPFYEMTVSPCCCPTFLLKLLSSYCFFFGLP